MPDSLGDRMKQYYEDRGRVYLTRRTPAILRIDGRAFHTFTRTFEKPFDTKFSAAMDYTTSALMKQIQGAKMAYVQSDEISVLLTDYDELNSGAWFDYNVQKMTSIAASTATAEFNSIMAAMLGNATCKATFDCRVFNIPQNEIANYFLWRAKDWHRNSVQMYGRAHFSHRELHGKSQQDIHDMLHDIHKNWAIDVSDRFRNGCVLLADGKTYHPMPNYDAMNVLVNTVLDPIPF